MTLRNRRSTVLGIVAIAIGLVALLVWRNFEQDIAAAQASAAHGSVMIQTHCGPIEYQADGEGMPLLKICGRGTITAQAYEIAD